MNRKNLKWIVAAAAVAVGLIAIFALNTGGNIVYFYTPQEALAQALPLSTKTIRVGGLVEPGSLKREEKDLKITFRLTDLKGSIIPIIYFGAPPDLFKEGQGVVAEGRINQDGAFLQATKLLVKHSEEYRKPGDPTMVEKDMLRKSIIGE